MEFYFYDMQLDRQTIEKIAVLARLNLTEAEKEMYAEQLSRVFDYVAMLNEVDTAGVQETSQLTGLEHVVREDVVVSCDEQTREALIDQFPDRVDRLLKVKAVFS